MKALRNDSRDKDEYHSKIKSRASLYLSCLRWERPVFFDFCLFDILSDEKKRFLELWCRRRDNEGFLFFVGIGSERRRNWRIFGGSNVPFHWCNFDSWNGGCDFGMNISPPWRGGNNDWEGAEKMKKKRRAICWIRCGYCTRELIGKQMFSIAKTFKGADDEVSRWGFGTRLMLPSDKGWSYKWNYPHDLSVSDYFSWERILMLRILSIVSYLGVFIKGATWGRKGKVPHIINPQRTKKKLKISFDIIHCSSFDWFFEFFDRDFPCMSRRKNRVGLLSHTPQGQWYSLSSEILRTMKMKLCKSLWMTHTSTSIESVI